jgi:hypothetical protein
LFAYGNFYSRLSSNGLVGVNDATSQPILRECKRLISEVTTSPFFATSQE